MFSFSMQNLRRNPKDTAFFAFSILMTSAIIAIFFCIINNPYYGDSGAAIPSGYENADNIINTYQMSQDALINAFDRGIGSGIFTVMLSVLIIAICIMTIFFSHNFYLITKAKDLGILLMSGCSSAKLVKFLVVQNFVVILCISPIGILLGLCCSPLLNALIYARMGISAPIFVLPWTSFAYAWMSMVLVSVWLVILDFGFVVRCDSLDSLLKQRTQMKGRKSKGVFLQLVYLLVYLSSILFILSYPVEYVTMIYMIYVGVFVYFGAVNVFRYVLPNVLAWLQKHLFFDDPHRLLSLANIQYSVANSSQLVTLVLLSTSILFYYLCKFQQEPATWMIVMFTYVVIMVLVITCIIYKLASDAFSKEKIYARMCCIGYLKKDIKKVIRQEVFGFYFAIFFVAFFPLLAILWTYVHAHQASIAFLCTLLGIFFLFLFAGACIMNVLYQKLILHETLGHVQVQE